MLRVYRWFRGYRVLEVKQSMGRRVWNIAAREQIFLWDISQDGEIFQAKVSRQNYPHLLQCLQESAILPDNPREAGLHATLHRYRKRWGLAAGLVLLLAGLYLSQQFVWTVRVEGVSPTMEQQILQKLPALNIKPGTAKKNLDTYWLPISLRLACPELSWAALNLYGTTAIVRAKEITPAPPLIDTKVPANLVAARDGQIASISVTDGKVLVEKGDVVQKGQVLVSGVWQDRWGMTHLLRANGEVKSKVPLMVETGVQLARPAGKLTGKVMVRRTLTCFGKDVPLTFAKIPTETCKIEQQRDDLHLFGLALPAILTTERFIFFEPITVSRTQEQALAIAHRQLALEEQRLLEGGDIYQRELEAAADDQKLTLIARYVVLQNIGVQQEIQVQSQNEHAGNRP